MISDYLPNFIIIEDMYASVAKKTQIIKRDTKNFKQNSFIDDLKSLKVSEKILLENDVNTKYDLFQVQFLNIIDKHAPLKKLSKREIRLKSKPWITKGIHKSIKVKNQFYTKFMQSKDTFYYNGYKIIRDKN